MTIQDIYKEVVASRKELKELKAMILKASEEWVSEREAALLIGMSLSNLRKIRYEGKIEHWRVRPTGRGVQYLKSSLAQQFITNT